MRGLPVAGIQPGILRWARETAGYTLSDTAAKIKRSAEELSAWETGTQAPTYPQLEKLAYEIYKRPIAIFFLPKPPEESTPKQEFRTLPDAELDNLIPDTRFKIRKAHAYQISLREVFENVNPSERKIWQRMSLVYSNNPLDVARQAQKIREHIGITISEQSKWKDVDAALKSWRYAIEDNGVFIFKDTLKQGEISGFCLTDAHFPLIYINNSTPKTRQVFSLAHELAHLLMDANGMSKLGDPSYIDKLPDDRRRLEQFCNAIAAEVLIPTDDFQEQSKQLLANVENISDSEIENLSHRYQVSREAILRRFLNQGRVSADFYKEKARLWIEQQKPKNNDSKRVGNWYNTTNMYFSPRFVREVISQHYNQRISLEQAVDLLGINTKNFDGLEQKILQGTSA